MIPIFWLVSGDQILVRDDIGLCQSLCNLQPTPKLAHIGNDLMGSSIALVCPEDRDTTTGQRCSQCLYIADNLGHVRVPIRDHFGC